jgi:hypothetical protein
VTTAASVWERHAESNPPEEESRTKQSGAAATRLRKLTGNRGFQFDLTPMDLKTSHELNFGWFEGDRTVYVNGQELPMHNGSRFDISAFLHSGHNAVAVLVKTTRRPGGFASAAELEQGKAPEALALHWQVSGDTAGSLGKWQDPALDDSKWESVALNQPPANGPESSATVPVNLVWYRLHFALPSPDAHVWVPWKLHLEAAGNGFIYLNGHALGRWWEIGPQKDFFLPECWLNFGPGTTNVVTLCLRPTKGSPSVSSATVLPYRDFAETR